MSPTKRATGTLSLIDVCGAAGAELRGERARGAETGSLGDTSTLADPSVVDDLIENRQNRKKT